MDAISTSITDRALDNANLLQAIPTRSEIRLERILTAVLVVACVVTVPFSAHMWPATNLLFSGAGIASFAEFTTGLLLLGLALQLKHYPALALGLGYLTGGAVIFVNILFVHDVSVRLWVFRLWHTVFVTGVLVYAWMHYRGWQRADTARFSAHAQMAFTVAGALFVLLVLCVIYKPFSLPPIYEHGFYATMPDVLVNTAQGVAMLIAWWLLWRASQKTVLSIWMSVVACAVIIDILLFVVGGRLFSVGLYISKLNNLVAATLIFGLIFYRQIQMQGVLFSHRENLLRDNEALTRRALTDGLTGLPNRSWLDESLEREMAWARRHKKMFAVCVLDLDNFKPVNDQHGHAAGDELLIAFAQRLSGVLRSEEYLARLGGDEFVLILKDIQHLSNVASVMTRVVDVISRPFELSNDIKAQIGASVGVAVYPYIEEGEDILRAADLALYRSKENKTHRERIWTVHEVDGMPDIGS